MTREEVLIVFADCDSWETQQLLDEDYESVFEGMSGPILLSRDTRVDPFAPFDRDKYEEQLK